MSQKNISEPLPDDYSQSGLDSLSSGSGQQIKCFSAQSEQYFVASKREDQEPSIEIFTEEKPKSSINSSKSGHSEELDIWIFNSDEIYRVESDTKSGAEETLLKILDKKILFDFTGLEQVIQNLLNNQESFCMSIHHRMKLKLIKEFLKSMANLICHLINPAKSHSQCSLFKKLVLGAILKKIDLHSQENTQAPINSLINQLTQEYQQLLINCIEIPHFVMEDLIKWLVLTFNYFWKEEENQGDKKHFQKLLSKLQKLERPNLRPFQDESLGLTQSSQEESEFSSKTDCVGCRPYFQHLEKFSTEADYIKFFSPSINLLKAEKDIQSAMQELIKKNGGVIIFDCQKVEDSYALQGRKMTQNCQSTLKSYLKKLIKTLQQHMDGEIYDQIQFVPVKQKQTLMLGRFCCRIRVNWARTGTRVHYRNTLRTEESQRELFLRFNYFDHDSCQKPQKVFKVVKPEILEAESKYFEYLQFHYRQTFIIKLREKYLHVLRIFLRNSAIIKTIGDDWKINKRQNAYIIYTNLSILEITTKISEINPELTYQVLNPILVTTQLKIRFKSESKIFFGSLKNQLQKQFPLQSFRVNRMIKQQIMTILNASSKTCAIFIFYLLNQDSSRQQKVQFYTNQEEIHNTKLKELSNYQYPQQDESDALVYSSKEQKNDFEEFNSSENFDKVYADLQLIYYDHNQSLYLSSFNSIYSARQ